MQPIPLASHVIESISLLSVEVDRHSDGDWKFSLTNMRDGNTAPTRIFALLLFQTNFGMLLRGGKMLSSSEWSLSVIILAGDGTLKLTAATRDAFPTET